MCEYLILYFIIFCPICNSLFLLLVENNRVGKNFIFLLLFLFLFLFSFLSGIWPGGAVALFFSGELPCMCKPSNIFIFASFLSCRLVDQIFARKNMRMLNGMIQDCT